MKTFNSINSYVSSQKAIITIGTFDGVHIGHQKILLKLLQISKSENCQSVVLTFFPHPRMVLQHDNTIKLLNTLEEKVKLLEQLSIDNLIIHPFDQEFSQLSAADFVKNILVDQLKVQKIVIGYDHRFGRNRTADISDLIQFGLQYDFEIEQIAVEEIEAIAVSSTKIRNALLEGDIETATNYLGYNYSITGKVVKGKQLGRTIGFPTANIEINEAYKLIPKKGVYIVSSFIENQLVYGIMNIGNRPTLNGDNQTIEVHFLNFNKDIYNQNIEIVFIKYIREEVKFKSLADLKTQITKDQSFAINYISAL